MKQYVHRMFKRYDAKYQSKKRYLHDVVESWRTSGQKRQFRRGNHLLDRIETYRQLTKELLEEPGQMFRTWRAYRTFKKSYKTLHEMVKPWWRQWIEAIVFAGTVVFVIKTFLFAFYHVPTGSAEPNILVGDRVWVNKMAYRLGGRPKHGDLVTFNDPRFTYRSSAVMRSWQTYIGVAIPLLGLPEGPENVVKRVIALPGDTIEGRIENGETTLYRNGVKLREPYMNSHPLIGVQREVGLLPFSSIGPVRLPSFLREQWRRPLFYTFVSNVSLPEQPYYYLTQPEILVHPLSGDPILKYPKTPTPYDTFGPITLPAGKYWVMGDSRKNSCDSRYWMFLDEKHIHGRASFVIYSIDSEEPFWLFAVLRHPIIFWTKLMRWGRSFKPLWTYNNLSE